MKNRVIFIVKIIAAIAILFTSSYYWLRTVILHFGAGLRYGCLWLFRRGQKVSYKHIRYGSENYSSITRNVKTCRKTGISPISYNKMKKPCRIYQIINTILAY